MAPGTAPRPTQPTHPRAAATLGSSTSSACVPPHLQRPPPYPNDLAESFPSPDVLTDRSPSPAPAGLGHPVGAPSAPGPISHSAIATPADRLPTSTHGHRDEYYSRPAPPEPSSAGLGPADSEDTVGSPVTEGVYGAPRGPPRGGAHPRPYLVLGQPVPRQGCVQGPRVRVLLSSCWHKASVGESTSKSRPRSHSPT